jgi:protein required for attachment to host cells
MIEQYRNWILVVDDWQGRLYEPRDVPGGRRRLDLRATFEDHWEPREHGRPQALDVKNGHYDFAGTHHEDEERRRRFAGQMATWLDEKMVDFDVKHVDVLASPRTLGELRRAVDNEDVRGVEFHHADLGFLDPGELVRHPRVVELLERPPLSVPRR